MDMRLKAVAAHISTGVGFVDVGTDHGLVPAELARLGYSGNIIATDINPQPLEAARNTARAAGVEDRIEFLLCDGLSLCHSDMIDTIVIAGMGGELICRILDEAEWCLDSRYTLILQPMTKAEALRYWLVNNGCEIICEDQAQDGGTVYQIIVARFGGCTRLSDGELYTGKYGLALNKALYIKKLESAVDSFQAAVAGMSAALTAPEDGRLRLYRGILEELQEMRRAYGQGK